MEEVMTMIMIMIMARMRINTKSSPVNATERAEGEVDALEVRQGGKLEDMGSSKEYDPVLNLKVKTSLNLGDDIHLVSLKDVQASVVGKVQCLQPIIPTEIFFLFYLLFFEFANFHLKVRFPKLVTLL